MLKEGGIRRLTIEIGGKTSRQLEHEMEQEGINISSYAREMLHDSHFTTLETPKELDLAIVTVRNLGLKGYPTTDQVYSRIAELGGEFCPAETAAHLRLAYKNQPLGEWLTMGMKLIADRGGNPDVFGLERFEGGLWLGGFWANPSYGWGPEFGFVFSLRK